MSRILDVRNYGLIDSSDISRLYSLPDMANAVVDFAIELLKILTAQAVKNDQVIGENKDYYVTLWDLEAVVKKLIDKYGR